jgi:hypothetical protein
MKQCKNPECGKIIKIYKSSKREHCNDICKNRAAYIRKQIEDAPIIEMNKAIQKNYKILKKLKKMNLAPIALQTIKSHGFNFDALHKDLEMIDNAGKTISVSCIYDIKFMIDKENNLVFI